MKGDVLWTPPADARMRTRLGSLMGRLGFDEYDALRRWSVGEGLEEFWAAVWDEFDVLAAEPYRAVLSSRVMPGAVWFEGARLNYAEHVTRHAALTPEGVAVIGRSDSGERIELTWAELVRRVAATADLLREWGVGVGDRVAAYLPNIPESVVAFLATSSLGAIWTSCAPEFGVQAVVDRFGQVEPKLLLGVEEYQYGQKRVDRRAEFASIRAALPSVERVVLASELPVAVGGAPEPLGAVQVAPDHPLYVLYSSGTTGLPKPIVHGHGGILVEHLKVLGLHADLGPTDRFMWYTTTGWMMWNYLVSGLLLGATVVLFDGDPSGEGTNTLWRLAAEESVTWLGVGSPYLAGCARDGLAAGQLNDLSALRAVGATGAPLPPAAFRWVYEHVARDVMLSPISGGTDICSAFVGGSPLTPVWEGEIPCRYLGAAVEEHEGELVVTQPMPSMPVGFWGDADGSRYRAAYFEHFPGMWRHGDLLEITERGSCVIGGRSDATLNRGGIRVGTAEIYRVVEAVDGVDDSLIVHLEASNAEDAGVLVLFVAPTESVTFDDELENTIRRAVRSNLSPRHVPDIVLPVGAIPMTLSGKKVELPVKRILQGVDADDAVSRGSLRDPGALDALIAAARASTELDQRRCRSH